MQMLQGIIKLNDQCIIQGSMFSMHKISFCFPHLHKECYFLHIGRKFSAVSRGYKLVLVAKKEKYSFFSWKTASVKVASCFKTTYFCTLKAVCQTQSHINSISNWGFYLQSLIFNTQSASRQFIVKCINFQYFLHNTIYSQPFVYSLHISFLESHWTLIR